MKCSMNPGVGTRRPASRPVPSAAGSSATRRSGLYDVHERTTCYKLVYYHSVDRLYDEQVDQNEMHNLIGEPAYRSLREELQERLLRRLTQAGDPLRIWTERRARSSR